MKKLSYIIAASIAGLVLTSPITKCGTYSDKQIQVAKQEHKINDVETMQQLEDIIAENENVVVYMSATWCGPCKTYSPIYEEVAEKYKGDVVFCKIVLDEISAKEHGKIIAKYKVKHIPKTIFFKNGEEVYSKTGFIPKAELDLLVNTFLVGKNL